MQRLRTPLPSAHARERASQVMISHDNIIFEALSAFTMIFNGSGRPIPKELRIVSYLPLSHVAGQMLDIVGPLIVTGVGNG